MGDRLEIARMRADIVRLQEGQGGQTLEAQYTAFFSWIQKLFSQVGVEKTEDEKIKVILKNLTEFLARPESLLVLKGKAIAWFTGTELGTVSLLLYHFQERINRFESGLQGVLTTHDFTNEEFQVFFKKEWFQFFARKHLWQAKTKKRVTEKKPVMTDEASSNDERIIFFCLEEKGNLYSPQDDLSEITLEDLTSVHLVPFYEGKLQNVYAPKLEVPFQSEWLQHFYDYQVIFSNQDFSEKAAARDQEFITKESGCEDHDVLKIMIHSPFATVREAALQSFQVRAPAFRDQIESVLWSDSLEVRKAAIRAMQDDFEYFLPRIRQLASDENYQIRLMIISVMAKNPALFPHELRSLSNDEVDTVWDMAYLAMANDKVFFQPEFKELYSFVCEMLNAIDFSRPIESDRRKKLYFKLMMTMAHLRFLFKEKIVEVAKKDQTGIGGFKAIITSHKEEFADLINFEGNHP